MYKRQLLDDLDGTVAVQGLPLGGSPVAPADLSPEPTMPGSPAPVASPYSSTSPRPGIVSPSAVVVVPSSAAPVSVAPASVAPPSEMPSAAPASVAPSEAPYHKTDDPRLLEEPVDGLTAN